MASHKLSRKGLQASAPVSVDPEKPQWCCICFDTYSKSTRDEDAEVPVQLPCGHVFGVTCITSWTQSKPTCPLCRFELFDVEFDDNDEHDLWIGEHDSAIQPSGASSGYTSIYALVSEFPEEWITISELRFSAARNSTAAHRLSASLSAPPQNARQPYRPHAQMGRRYSQGKTSASHFESEDIWITALVYEGNEVAAAGVDDGWITALDENGDEADDLELHRQLYLCEAFMLSLPDSLFDDLLAEHVQWMAELSEARYDAYDLFEFLI